MGKILNTTVGEVSPSIYQAAAKANLNPQEKLIYEQLMLSVKKAKELRAMPIVRAKTEFKSLTPDAQQAIRAIYPNAEFAKDEPGFFDKVLSAASALAKKGASPVVSTFELAGKYGQGINTPYSATRLSQQPNQQLWTKKTWDDAYNGKNLFDIATLDRLSNQYGKADVLLAKGLLEGKTPGEIIEEYGKIDENILAAVSKSFNEPDVFKKVIEDVKYAQFSPGRDTMRGLTLPSNANVPQSGGFLVRFITGDMHNPQTLAKWQKMAKRTSGFIDFFYQIFADPFTYFTGGTSKAITRGEKLADGLIKAANQGDVTGGVRTVFADKDVRKLWDEQAGPMLKSMAKADSEGDRYAKAVLRRDFGRNFPGLNSDEQIEFYIKNEIFDAASAEKKFTDVSNVHYLLSGRVDGISYTRNGIATARNQRYLSQGRSSYAYNLFNPTTSGGEKLSRTVDDLQAKGANVIEILTKVGEEIDLGINPLVTQLKDIDSDVKLSQRQATVLGKLLARSPSGGIIHGENVLKTIDNFRLVARQVLPRDIADVVTYYYMDSSQDERLIIVRNLYAAIMDRMGLTGVPGGKKLRDEILNKTFNNRSGMTLIANTQVNDEIAKEVSSYVLKVENDVPYIQSRGIIHPFQVAEMIAPLPYEKIIEYVATNRGLSIRHAFDGITRNKYVSGMTNLWTILTLYPRLGIRSSIDEAFMYALSAPLRDLRDFALGKGRKLGKAATRFTGSKAAIGPIKSGLNKILRRTPDNEFLPIAERETIAQELSTRYKIPVEEVTHMMIREETASRVLAAFQNDKSINFNYLKDLLVHHPDVLNSMASSVGARTSISGTFDEQIIDAIFTPSMLSKALNDIGVKTGKKFRTLSTRELRATNEKWLTLAHFDAWYLQMVNNTRSLPNGRVLDPATVFFANDGLRTAKNFSIARSDILKAVGVEWDWATKQYVVKDSVATKEFLSLFGDSVYFRQRNLPDAEIARIHAETMLLDMRNTFHGGPNAFNEKLFDLITSRHTALKEVERKSGQKILGKWSKASANISFEDFEKATDGYKPMGDINTRIEFDGFVPKEDLPSMFEKFGNALMDQMDRQVTGLFRQPAVMIAYSRLREAYAGFERQYADDMFKREIAAKPWLNQPDLEEKALERAEQIAKKRYAEIAMNEAIDTILKYADNPAIRSNFAMNVRTIGRFYRATEDFWRRYYRLVTEKPLQTLYRMRLVHQGLDARGEIFEDEKGEPYVVIPTDTIINSAVEPIVRGITGGEFKVPQFNEITLKLRLTNPSFAPDAGQPALSGPFAAISMLGFKALLGELPGSLKPFGIKVGEAVDNIALGNIGENLTIQRAITPLFLQNLWALYPKHEKDRQEVTAAFQAISYMQAFGYEMPDPSDPVKVDQFLRDVRIAAHNVIATRAILGMISFASPTLKESQGLPDYYKSVGIPSFRGAFYDILESIAKTESDDVFDPYELALATFIGNNPGKIVYTVSRNDRNTKVIIQKTDEVQNWIIGNEKFISQYKDAAFIFAPQVGDFNSSVYAWLEANDFVSQPKLEDYLKRVQVAQAKQAYFAIEDREKAALEKEAGYIERKKIIDDATRQRALLKSANPLLQQALTVEGGFDVAEEENIFSNMERALLDKNAPINQKTREKMALATKMVRQFIIFSTDLEYRNGINFTETKREKKLAVENFLNDLVMLDPTIREANRAVFQPILDFYSRDTRVAFRR